MTKAGWFALALLGFVGLSHAGDEKPKEAPGLTKDIAELLATSGDLAGEPAIEAGALLELLTQVEKSTTPPGQALKTKMLQRLVMLSQNEVLSALASEQPIPEPFGDALEHAWDARAAMPDYFGRLIIESILNLAPRSRSAQALLGEYESYQDDMGLPRNEFYVRLRKAQLEFLERASEWRTSADLDEASGDVGDDDMLSDVLDSIYCEKPKSNEDSEDEPEIEYPRIWKDSDARDLIEKLGQRLIDMKFSVVASRACLGVCNPMYWWSSLIDTLAEKAKDCRLPTWQSKLEAKEAEIDARLEEIERSKDAAIADSDSDSNTPSLLDPEDESREQQNDDLMKTLEAENLSTPDAWALVAGIADPLVRVRVTVDMLGKRFTTAENIDEVLKSLFELGGALRDSSTEGYFYFLWKMLANEDLAKFKRDAHVRKQIAPLLVEALNRLPSGWRTYFTFSEADGDWTRSSWYAQTQLRNRVSLFFRESLGTDDLAAAWKRWEAKEPLEAKKAFAEIRDPSLRWVFRYEWFSSRVQKYEEERDRKEFEARMAEAEAKEKAKAKGSGGKTKPTPTAEGGDPDHDDPDHPR